ncbi:uncharacterized protein TNIN_112631 [Trichonephila inaurata madagascariensis]|uniref:Uncharacterized protein n=1 Tax=Trichonephila inaurata madagascariensis TaxID=2747483 RepID=A0A8X7C5N7_9ARAC|nr:uncharacterized protein TNIN_112631 [Trichonephila inaurata madagascariensis]
MDLFFPKVSYMVSLTEISSSQEEMQYITRSRNALKFRTASRKDYRFLNSTFRHIVLCSLERIPELETCLRHTLSKVMNSHVLLHNYTPLAQWTLINIGENRFLTEGNPYQQVGFIQRDDEYENTNFYLIASLGFQRRFSFNTKWRRWNILQSQFSKDTTLSSLQVKNAKSLNSMHTSGWRRLFADNFIDFSCTDSDIASYVKEQAEASRPVHVFKKIIKRERGETFNPFRILESIASPYYYVLPQHGEGPHDLTRSIISDCWLLRNSGNPPPWDELFCFESEAKIVRKKITRLNEDIH